MKSKILHIKMQIRYKFFVLLLITSVATIGQKNTKKELFISSIFTKVNSFSSGVEGPAVNKDGTLFAVNFIHDSTVGKINANGTAEIFITLPNGSVGNGIRFNHHGDMLIADYTNHNILKVDMRTKSISVFAHESRMNQPNDIAIDSEDRLYASDPNWKDSTGKIWRIDVNGNVTLLEENMGTANGIEVSPDEKTLYVNESVQRKVWAYDLKNGQIRNKRLVIQFPDFEMDGMRSDVKGNLYIVRYGKGTVVKISPSGKILKEITLHGKDASNLAFGGSGGCSIYVTVQDNGNIETFKVDEPGREWKMLRK